MFADYGDLHVYATAGFGFKTPTPTPTPKVPTRRSSGQIGVNFVLRAAPSNCVEAGPAWRVIPNILR